MEWQQARKDSRPPGFDVPKVLEEVSLARAFDVLPLHSQIDLCDVMFCSFRSA
jgi:hypothetical protein